MTMSQRPSIKLVGENLFGRNWQSDLARAIGKSVNTVQRWADGSRQPRSGSWQDILALMRARRTELDRLIGQLEAAEKELLSDGGEPGSRKENPGSSGNFDAGDLEVVVLDRGLPD